MRSLRPRSRTMAVVLSVGLALGSVSRPSGQSGGIEFVEETDDAGVGATGFSYSCAWGDYDRDGRDDLYVSYIDRPDILYRNDGNRVFTDVTVAAGIQDPANTGGEGVTWADTDNDGDLDLFIAQGCEPVPNDPSQFYLNN